MTMYMRGRGSMLKNPEKGDRPRGDGTEPDPDWVRAVGTTEVCKKQGGSLLLRVSVLHFTR